MKHLMLALVLVSPMISYGAGEGDMRDQRGTHLMQTRSKSNGLTFKQNIEMLNTFQGLERMSKIIRAGFSSLKADLLTADDIKLKVEDLNPFARFVEAEKKLGLKQKKALKISIQCLKNKKN